MVKTFPQRDEDDERGTVLRGAVDDKRPWPCADDAYFLGCWVPMVHWSPINRGFDAPPWHSYVVLPVDSELPNLPAL